MLWFCVCAALLFASLPLSAQPFTLKPGDHVSIIGNTLADRMQHDGWLETIFYARFPRHELVFRNLGFPGDEISHRIRSANFGSPAEWLTRTKTDVVFAFFGYNESYAGETGLPKFKDDLEKLIDDTLKARYNGTSSPRLVLFSPIAHEDLKSPHLPDGSANNARLALYTKAMAEMARKKGVAFVDLYTPTLALYKQSAKPLTINGVHLNEYGNEQVARIIDRALFGNEQPYATEKLEKIRQAVLDKNFHWFNRYRTVDGYSIYGGRAALKFQPDGQTNFVVMQREMEILDVMTANRDKRIWAVAQGGDLEVDDANIPEFLHVKTNKPGKLDGGKHSFLSGEEAIAQMTVAKNMKVNLFASEKEWPELVNPVQMTFDAKGRLWVAVWPTYPHWKPKEDMNDKILIFEDTNGDGKADMMTVFADKLHCPTGMELWNGGVLIAQQPDVMFLKDTDGDDKADLRTRVINGIDSADTHHAANSFVLDPGGALYFQEGTFHHTQVESPWLPTQRCANAGVFRFEPRTFKFEVYVNFGFANPHGHVFDRWGQDIIVDGTGAVPYHGTLFSGQTDFPQRHSKPPTVYKQKSRPCPGMEILSSNHFPPEMQGNLLVADVINFQGILQYKLQDKGASFMGVEQEPIVQSRDPSFRPSDLRVGPDGAIYFLDWHNPIIGHMQHNLRDPSRDREHGRIFRVTYENRPLSTPAKIAGEPIAKLLDLLKSPEDRVRYRTRQELGARDGKAVIAELAQWMESLDRKDADYEHHMLEALWLHQNLDIVNEGHLKRMLRSSNFRARAAATRVLCYWRDRVKEPLNLLRVQINDEHPRVRLEAIRALSFFHEEPAVYIAAELLTHPLDEYLDYTFKETMNTLEKRVGSKFDRKNIAASLLKYLDGGDVSVDRKAKLIETVCRLGGATELGQIWDRLQKKDAYPPELQRQAMEWLAEAAAARRVQPGVTDNAMLSFLRQTDAASLPEAIRLAQVWKLKGTSKEIRVIAFEEKKPLAARLAALDAMAAFNDPESHQDLVILTGPDFPMALRFHASAALAQIDLKQGASTAADNLSIAKEGDDIAPMIEAFLVRKGGSDALAAAIAKKAIPADTAKRVIRVMFLLGRNDKALADVTSKLAGLSADVKPPSAAEVKTLIAEVQSKGDAARGERVFRRADLGCIKCHAISKAGGNIGPDLGPVGAASPIDYVVTSILDPNQAIKEEYLTKVIATTSGQIHTGIVAERTKNQVTLKDATGKLVKIPASDIDDEQNGKSLMPEGITRILTKNELLDLLRFVSELGKPGPYALRNNLTVQRWKMLRETPAVLKEGVPNRELVRDLLLAAPEAKWEIVYSMVNGNLPLDEIAKSGTVYLQGEIDVTRGGVVQVLAEAKGSLTFWVDEEAFENQTEARVELSPGRHRITVRVESREGANVRVELRKPANSNAEIQMVSGRGE
jgi:putative heme-binding domain-containing protein